VEGGKGGDFIIKDKISDGRGVFLKFKRERYVLGRGGGTNTTKAWPKRSCPTNCWDKLKPTTWLKVCPCGGRPQAK